VIEIIVIIKAVEGGQSKDDEKRKEIFFNEVLAKDEINRLLNKKVITSAKKYTQNGVSDEVNFNRDENNIINKLTVIKDCSRIYFIKKMGFAIWVVE
jgi:adenine-specific DNA-methyltransferase